ncbi:MAG: putative PEP-binding protein, partial [Scrofimicrobium sp.]
ADTPLDSERAIDFGAQGIGLCRTEHMFLGERRPLVERVILSAPGSDDRQEAYDALAELQKGDYLEMLKVMDGKPMTVRLIDPPLHEFLPDLTSLEIEAAVAKEKGEELPEERQRLLTEVRRLHEQNPMLGLRGVRLGLYLPGLFLLQARALAEAASELKAAGGDPRPEIMVPLVASVRELQIVRDQIEPLLKEIEEEHGVSLDIPIGCMVELPRACVLAEHLAREADFFSFGTNDLTQTTWGFSRDDVEGVFFPLYIEEAVFGVSPFESIDVQGVGKLVQMGAEGGRKTKANLKLGVCGEHGGDPDSIHFFNKIGLDYVSCSPFRVPVARLEAGRATVMEQA